MLFAYCPDRPCPAPLRMLETARPKSPLTLPGWKRNDESLNNRHPFHASPLQLFPPFQHLFKFLVYVRRKTLRYLSAFCTVKITIFWVRAFAAIPIVARTVTVGTVHVCLLLLQRGILRTLKRLQVLRIKFRSERIIIALLLIIQMAQIRFCPDRKSTSELQSRI